MFTWIISASLFQSVLLNDPLPPKPALFTSTSRTIPASCSSWYSSAGEAGWARSLGEMRTVAL